MDRFDRIFLLNNLLRSRRYPVSHKTLEERLECSRATVTRTIEDLRDYLGAPLEYDRKHNGYYYSRSEDPLYELPGLWFNGSELHALLSVQQLLANVQPGLLDSHLGPLRKRIDKILSHRRSGGGIADRVRILQAAARPAGEWFQLIAGALANRRRLRIGYYDRARDATTDRDISPQRLVYYRDNWYLDAWCHLRHGLRTFSLDVIRSAGALDRPAKPVDPARLDAHVGSSYGIFAGPPRHLARLLFSPQRARWVASERWHPDQVSSYLKDGSYRLEIPYSDPRELVMDILKHGPEVEVLDPPALRAQVSDLLRSAAARYPDAD